MTSSENVAGSWTTSRWIWCRKSYFLT